MTPTPIAVVLAAGKGERVGGDVPKQLQLVGGKPLLAHAVDQHLRLGHEVILVINEAHRDAIADALGAVAVTYVVGGATRRESVLAGFAALPDDGDEDTAVILRNAASPNVSDAVLLACIEGLSSHYGMQAYRPSEETTVVHDGVTIESLIPRSATGFTCDPTVYRLRLAFDIERELHQSTAGETTLDLARRLGATIGLVESPTDNIKVTTREDVARADAVLS